MAALKTGRGGSDAAANVLRNTPKRAAAGRPRHLSAVARRVRSSLLGGRTAKIGQVNRRALDDFTHLRGRLNIYGTPSECAMAAGIDPARTFSHRGCRARCCCPKLTNVLFPRASQAPDPIDEASRLRTFKGEPVKLSKSSMRLAWRSRAVATALLLPPSAAAGLRAGAPVLVCGVQAAAARAGVGPVTRPGRAVRENPVSEAVCGRARSRALADHQPPRVCDVVGGNG